MLVSEVAVIIQQSDFTCEPAEKHSWIDMLNFAKNYSLLITINY